MTGADSDDQRSHRRRRTIEAAVAVALLLAALFAALVAQRSPSGPAVVDLSGTTMSTTYSVKVVEPAFESGARDAIQALIDAELELVDKLMSRYRPGSELDRLNRSRSTEPIRVSPELLDVLERAAAISEQSSGAFDVTVGPLIKLWGFDDKRGRRQEPDPARVAEVRTRVGYRLLEIDQSARTVRKRDPELDLDLSAIAKGYAVDRVALALEAQGHKNYLVEVGGEVRCAGASHRGTPWRVAVERPVEGAREIFRVVELSGRALATSGDYRNFYEIAGRRFSHTIDPRTGRPVAHQLASVTVVHDECVTADALATALTVMGPREGLAFAEKQGLSVLFIERGERDALRSFATRAFERDHPARAATR